MIINNSNTNYINSRAKPPACLRTMRVMTEGGEQAV